MEFDETEQGRWKVSLWCFLAAMMASFVLGFTGFAWSGANIFVGATINLFGLLFAVLSLAAKENNKTMGRLTLLLNLVLPGFILCLILLAMLD